MSGFKGDKVGRRGLSEVKMNPAVFLHLAGQQARARQNGTLNNLGFNENQLYIAFTKYLRDEQGQSRRGEKLDGDALKAIAKGFIRNASKKYQAKNPDRKQDGPKQSLPQPSDAQKRAADMLRENGWDVEPDELPDDLQNDTETPGDPLEAMDRAEMAVEVLHVAQEFGPSIAALIAVAAIELHNSTEIRLQAGHLLADKYEDEAGSLESKENCLLGLGQVLAEEAEQKALAPKLEEVAHKEDNPVLKAQILQLARPDNTGTDAAAINDFADNSLSACRFSGRFEAPPAPYAPQMTIVHDARQKNTKNPFYLDPTLQPPGEKRA